MVQIYERPPTFKEKLGMSLGGTTGNLVSGLVEGLKERKENKSLEKLFGKSFKGLSPEMKELAVKSSAKSQESAGFLDKLLGGKGESDQGGFNKLNANQKAALAFTDPAAFKAYEQLEKDIDAKEEKERTKEGLQDTLGEMVNTLMEGNLGVTASRFSKKGRRDVQYFDTLGTQLESIGKDMVSKGVLSAPRFAYLLSNLPTSGKTDAANAGALEAWAKELDLNIPGIEKLKSLYEEKPKIKKAQKGKEITEDAMRQIYKEAGGDYEKAKKLATEAGYEIE
jgi:hypothetical protein